ncbi:4520_t:CDS:1, partial [Cetraspora pellucida]
EVTNDKELKCKIEVDELHKDKATELQNKFVVFSPHEEAYEFLKFLIPIKKIGQRNVIMAYRKPENVFKFLDARKNPVEIEIDITNND